MESVTKDSISSPNAWMVLGKGGLIQKHSSDCLDAGDDSSGRVFDDCSEHVSTLNMQLEVFSIKSSQKERIH